MKAMMLISGVRLATSVIKTGGIEINSYTWYAIAAILFILIVLYLILVFRKPDKL
jgi:hypothetical protein